MVSSPFRTSLVVVCSRLACAYTSWSQLAPHRFSLEALAGVDRHATLDVILAPVVRLAFTRFNVAKNAYELLTSWLGVCITTCGLLGPFKHSTGKHARYARAYG